MRSLILGLLFVSAYSASACEIARTQFIGKVKGHYDVLTSENSSECFYQIEFNPNQWWPSVECSVTRGEVAGLEFRDSLCVLKDGDSVSGVLARSGSSIYLE